MSDPNHISTYESIRQQIKLAFDEHKIRRNLAGHPDNRTYVLRGRNQAWLDRVESTRRIGIRKLNELTKDITEKQIDLLIKSDVIKTLLKLVGFLWREEETVSTTLRIIIDMIAVATDEQLHQIVDIGCTIPLREELTWSNISSISPAIMRILEAGKTKEKELGRNIYADQVLGNKDVTYFKKLFREYDEPILKDILQILKAHTNERTLEVMLNDQSERGQGWTMLHPFFKDRIFPKWNAENSTKVYDESHCPLKIKLFISHRWEDTNEPDPSGVQFRSLIEYLSRVFMIANGYIDRDEPLAQEFTTTASMESYFKEHKAEECNCRTLSYLDMRNVLGNDDVFYARVHNIITRQNFYLLLKHVHVWYDYSSMPQVPRTPDEDKLFEYRLNQLADIATQSDMVVLWGDESLKRGWCLLEGIIGEPLHFCSTPRNEQRQIEYDPHAFSTDYSNRRIQEMPGFQGRNSKNVSTTVKQIRQEIQGKSQQETEHYLKQNNITCTHPTDIAIVARLMHQYVKSLSNANGK